jgi:hypothetical protein
MNKEFTMEWDLTGMRIKGNYLGSYPVEGTVRLSRVKYGGTVNHHIVLDQPVYIFGEQRDTVILEHSCITQVMDSK